MKKDDEKTVPIAIPHDTYARIREIGAKLGKSPEEWIEGVLREEIERVTWTETHPRPRDLGDIL